MSTTKEFVTNLHWMCSNETWASVVHFSDKFVLWMIAIPPPFPDILGILINLYPSGVKAEIHLRSLSSLVYPTLLEWQSEFQIIPYSPGMAVWIPVYTLLSWNGSLNSGLYPTLLEWQSEFRIIPYSSGMAVWIPDYTLLFWNGSLNSGLYPTLLEWQSEFGIKSYSSRMAAWIQDYPLLFWNGLNGYLYTVDLVIFACLNFREFLILRLFTKFRIREFSFFFSGSNIMIIFARFLNSRVCPPREIREN